MTTNTGLFRGILKLKTLCVGGSFKQPTQSGEAFPQNVLTHVNVFQFHIEPSFEKALDIVTGNRDIDLVFIDTDDNPFTEIATYMTQVREIRPKLPMVIFSNSADDKMRHLMRAGATWHFVKTGDTIEQIVEQVRQHVFSPINWQAIFAQYANDNLKPRIEPGLSYADVEAVVQNLEERYIIKRLFAGSDVVQIFRMDEGFSGSRIYTIKPAHQLKRILKIDTADRLEAIQQKQEQLIQPRLNRQVGQIQGKLVRGEHLAGACYSLAGSYHDTTITLNQFLLDQNRVRKELIDKILDQLRVSLEQLYAGNADAELRYWAPLYARVLPPKLTLTDASLVEPTAVSADFVLNAEEFTTLSAVPGNQILQAITQAVTSGGEPEIILHGFEVAEFDTREGVLYLHDDLIARYPISAQLKGKNHPILRFKVQLKLEERELLTHPVFRRGKRISVRGIVSATQETVLAQGIQQATGTDFAFDEVVFEMANGRFPSPIETVQNLLWEVGREDMIVPIPQVSPVVHGDLNTSNILVEVNDEMPLWLIDFSDARPGHLYFDLAKLEVEFRTHVLFRLFKEMVNEGLWDSETAVRFALLVENILLLKAESDFNDFMTSLRNFQPDWYDALYTQFPLYAENLLYFLHSLRQIAESYSPERFKHHYPVAIFFHSLSVMKFRHLDEEPWQPWAKRLALCAALVSGKHAVEAGKRPYQTQSTLAHTCQQSALAIITVGSGGSRKYLVQWNNNWDMFNLVGGKIDNDKGDRHSFARAIQRKLWEELGLRSSKDYRIVKEFKPIFKRQFSRRQYVFKDYEFRIFQVELLPRHPISEEEFEWFAQRFSADPENVLVSSGEIERLISLDNRPISDTTHMILQELGEITAVTKNDLQPTLECTIQNEEFIVSRGKAQIRAEIVNPRYSNLIENITLEVIPSAAYETDPGTSLAPISSLEVGESQPINIWVQPKEKQAKLKIRATYYDMRGNEYRQLIERAVHFQSEARTSFHINNPYVVGKPLTPASASLYVGREDVFAWIEENLLGKTQPHTLILYGQRRMGKTSTLYQLVGGERGRTIREYPTQPIFPVYIDLQRLAGCETTEFMSRLSLQIVTNLAKRGILIPPRQSWSQNGVIWGQFDAFLDEVEAALPHNGLLVLVIDELEQMQESIEYGRLNANILPYLRSLMQHRTKVTFILAGTNQLMADYWSSIFHVGISREIGLLDRVATDKLIRDPVSPMIQYDDLAVDRIWLAAKGHPYFSQLICHRLISAINLEGRHSKLITIADVRETINLVVNEDDSHLQHLWHDCPREEQLILSSLAGTAELGEETVSRSEIAARLRDAQLSDEQVLNALNRLELRRMVTRTPVERALPRRLAQSNGWQPTLVSKDHAYTISFDLLRQWVALKHPLGSLI